MLLCLYEAKASIWHKHIMQAPLQRQTPITPNSKPFPLQT